MKRAGIALVALLVVALAGSALAAAQKKVYYEKPYGQIAYKPKRIEFSDLTLRKIKWRHWNSRVARGRGRAVIYGPAGTVRGSARLKMFKRHTVGNRRFYGCMTGTTKAGGQTEKVVWPPGCDN